MEPWPTDKSPFESSMFIPPTQNLRFEAVKRPAPRTTIEVTITEYDKVKDGRESYYRYHIQANRAKRTPHRYSEFEWLRAQLSLRFPGCITPELPPKEGVSSYLYSHEASFYEYRKHGLEVFLQAIAANTKLSNSEEFRSFLEDDELNFGMKVRDTTERPGVLARVWDVGSSVAASVSWYIYGEPQGPDAASSSSIEEELEAAYARVKEEMEGVQSLCASLVTSTQLAYSADIQASIQHNHDLAQAYTGLADLDNSLQLSYKLHSDAHIKAAGVFRDMEQRVRDLYEKEAQDYLRWALGGIEAWQRRQQLAARIGEERGNLQQDPDRRQQKIETMETDWKDAGADLKRDFAELNAHLSKCKAALARTFVELQRKASEELKEVWTEACTKLQD